MKTAAIIGTGALGMLFGAMLQNTYGRENISFVMDRERYLRRCTQRYTINGAAQDFRLVPAEDAQPVDLVIVATKYTAIDAAMDVMEKCVGQDTVIISLLNGIISESVLAGRYGAERIPGCVALGMDATRTETDLVYANPGRLQLGTLQSGQEDIVKETAGYLRAAGIAIQEMPDIRRALWAKFMLNVGINQTCMVYDVPYGPALHDPVCRADLEAVMREAIAVANAEGVALTEADMDTAIRLIDTLDPTLSPSMRQDRQAGRKTEVGLFAGTVLQYAEKHGIDTPVNRRYAQKVREIEEKI